MLMPKRVKHRKWHKGSSKGNETRGAKLSFGSHGLKAMETLWLPARRIEAGRRAIIRYLRKGGKMWIRIFPDKPVTSKGAEVPMGGGKGAVSHYVVALRPGRIIYEIDGLQEKMAKEALKKAAAKLGLRTKIVQRDETI
ncbi:MAG: 50S ribosomal protein L16 [Candidatus Wildermuthbacteria bacterium]|nr:50S ribosomal protein L16 [Candidatus Wildermuthbacteria bacterium]MBI2121379.1 50S ribosomal protein L16 [Candidatus Wildermuthbacteria bacterium]MBI2647930.1 50S ribosomal protein L16 [Candidatus Wildermuthbacteria bacterium]